MLFDLLVILTASLKYLYSFMSNKHVLCTFLLVKQSENALARAQHYIFIKVFQALNHQVNITVASDIETLCDGNLMPDLVQILQCFL